MLNLKAIVLAYTVTNWYTVYQKNSVDVKKNLTSDNKGGFHLFIKYVINVLCVIKGFIEH